MIAKIMRKITAQGKPRAAICQRIGREASESLDIEHLTVAVITTGRAGNVRRHLAAALGAALEDRCTPTLGATAHFLTAFGLAALWNGHGLELV
jgi:hypothetical protein